MRTNLLAAAVIMSAIAMAGRSPATAAAASRGQAPPDAPVVVEARFDRGTEQVQIPVGINGVSFWCSLDSGFSALIAIEEGKAARAGFTMGPAGPTPDGAPPRAGDAALTAAVTVGSLSLGPKSILVRRMPEGTRDMECVMGVGVLRRFVVEFDHMAPRVYLHERAAYRPPSGARAIPLIFRTNLNVPFVKIELTFADGTRRSAQVVPDTGTSYYAAAFGPAFTRDVRPRIPRTARLTNRPEISGGPVQIVAARLAAVSIGALTMREPVVALIESDAKDEGFDDGTLGSGFLRRFTVAFDFEGRRMYLEPNARLSAPQAFDASGVGFRQVADGYQVGMVLAESPAALAGMREGDRLVTIDGRLARDLTPVQLRDLLGRPGVTCDLRLDRAGQAVQLLLGLQDPL